MIAAATRARRAVRGLLLAGGGCGYFGTTDARGRRRSWARADSVVEPRSTSRCLGAFASATTPRAGNHLVRGARRGSVSHGRRAHDVTASPPRPGRSAPGLWRLAGPPSRVPTLDRVVAARVPKRRAREKHPRDGGPSERGRPGLLTRTGPLTAIAPRMATRAAPLHQERGIFRASRFSVLWFLCIVTLYVNAEPCSPMIADQ